LTEQTRVPIGDSNHDPHHLNARWRQDAAVLASDGADMGAAMTPCRWCGQRGWVELSIDDARLTQVSGVYCGQHVETVELLLTEEAKRLSMRAITGGSLWSKALHHGLGLVALLFVGCSGDFDVPDIASDLVPGVELCDYGAGPPLLLRFEEINCQGVNLGPYEHSKPGSGVGLCNASIPLDPLYPGLVAHVSCNADVTECAGIAEAPDGCMWGVSWR
jgi:hypothetical protein